MRRADLGPVESEMRWPALQDGILASCDPAWPDSSSGATGWRAHAPIAREVLGIQAVPGAGAAG